MKIDINQLLPNLAQYQIILASQSPRRQQFMRDLGLDFKVIKPMVDEIYNPNLERNEITEYLCEVKANAIISHDSNPLIISCDTIVWFDNKPVEKPENERHAKEMLQMLSGNTHEVISSVCVKTNHKKCIFSEFTTVKFSPLTNNEIDYYVEKFQPLDKAGAYGIQDFIGLIGIENIQGSYTNVVGMPMEKLYRTLINF